MRGPSDMLSTALVMLSAAKTTNCHSESATGGKASRGIYSNRPLDCQAVSQLGR